MGTLSQLITEQEYAEVETIAKTVYFRFCSRSHDIQLEREDLFHHGLIGLLEARKKFDADKGAWIPFMKLRVRGAMLDEIRKQAPLGQEDYQKIRQLHEAREELQRQGIEPTEEELSHFLGWSLTDVSSWRRQIPVLVPALHSEPGDDDEDCSGVVLTAGNIGPAEQTLRREMWQVVRQCLDDLPSPDLRIILEGRTLHDLGLKELAASFACTMENIRIKQKKAASLVHDCIVGKGWPVQGWHSVFVGKGEEQ